MNLPAPDAAAAAHSARVSAALAARIAQAGGWLPFARWMEFALHAPGLGYYAAGAAKFGAAGDFVTAPEISPLFGRCIARHVAHTLAAGGGEVLELGPGSGRLACDLLAELERLGTLPERYLLLEISPDLAARQRDMIARNCPALAARCAWISALPEKFHGALIANEVLDALPVHLVAWREDGPYERGVAWRDGAFAWEDRPLAPGPLRARAEALALPPGYLSEIGIAGEALVAELAGRLACGSLLLIDYGFPQREFYHPQRAAGTLMCHYRHHAHSEPFWLPGLQDITAHVDFSAIAQTGCAAGLELAGFATQAGFLIDCGITDLLAATSPADTAHYLPLVAGAQKLLSPAEMGELFKAIAFSRGVPGPLPGFARGDQRHRL